MERNRFGNVSPRRISGASSVSGGGYYSDERERHHSLSQVCAIRGWVSVDAVGAIARMVSEESTIDE